MTKSLIAYGRQESSRIIGTAFALGALYLVSLIAIHRAAGELSLEAPAPTVSASSYRQAAIETSRGTVTTLAATDGRVRIATMFYAHCPGMCPLTVDTIQSIERQLTAEQREKLAVVLLTFDPAHDSPAALREFEAERRIDSARWVLGRSSAADVAKFAAAFGLTYRTFEDGAVDHSDALVLIDSRGRVIARSTTTSIADPRFVASVRSALESR